MKFTVTVSDTGMDASALASFAQLMGGTPAPAINRSIETGANPNYSGLHHAAPGTHSTESDDNEQPNAAAPAVDSTGLPWDERIHAKSKAQNKDGSWRERRGVSSDLVANVTTELRQRGAQQNGMYMPPAMTQPPQTMQPPVMPNPAPMMPAPQPMMQPQPGPAPEPVYTPPPMMQPHIPQGAPVAAPAMDAGTFMNKLGALMQQNPGINQQWLVGICAEIAQTSGKPFAQITDVFNDPSLPATAIAVLAKYGVNVQ